MGGNKNDKRGKTHHAALFHMIDNPVMAKGHFSFWLFFFLCGIQTKTATRHFLSTHFRPFALFFPSRVVDCWTAGRGNMSRKDNMQLAQMACPIVATAVHHAVGRGKEWP
nr:hypothetical protein [Pandoravirus massiliensis]